MAQQAAKPAVRVKLEEAFGALLNTNGVEGSVDRANLLRFRQNLQGFLTVARSFLCVH